MLETGFSKKAEETPPVPASRPGEISDHAPRGPRPGLQDLRTARRLPPVAGRGDLRPVRDRRPERHGSHPGRHRRSRGAALLRAGQLHRAARGGGRPRGVSRRVPRHARQDRVRAFPPEPGTPPCGLPVLSRTPRMRPVPAPGLSAANAPARGAEDRTPSAGAGRATEAAAGRDPPTTGSLTCNERSQTRPCRPGARGAPRPGRRGTGARAGRGASGRVSFPVPSRGRC